MVGLCVQPHIPIAKVDISSLIHRTDEEQKETANSISGSSRGSVSITSEKAATTTSSPQMTTIPEGVVTRSTVTSSIPAKRHQEESPAGQSTSKRQSKWSPEEDALIIELRGSSMKWEDISKRLPGRSAISCRLHYQNYLERRSEWDDDKKDKLARLYERFKADMWSKIAEEMAIPWRAAEAMHWQIGELDMARRAGVTPFSLNPSSDYSRRIRRPSLQRQRSNRIRQLPSVAELTAGVPAYAPQQQIDMQHRPPSAELFTQGFSHYTRSRTRSRSRR